MSVSSVLLSDEDRALLLKVSDLLEEILKTLDILEDEDTMESIERRKRMLRLEGLETARNSSRS